ncbi:23S rRNA (adenine(2030)-N(6))-methyltransferase RlmJ [Terrihabitans rhizophilus]|jgi:23S rRNA (adenine2030-N6)-methyltransferase|uniref:Ribosomal RNA large subunit methyltransferase J n=1 Tax=Terrihabitans rhizophilus TaxID=3092662 RepID=A0ABU4RQG0_9HYPH|nr:23S rRNA (adenine(2030)-N(6))-methyltransferase RlmJ [Terrihabitans sp. PJ23]MDX6807083.1 23S rRNA (adenine(2030)-N(6))-methyltransferase RlmJ [Terrihabitans sp. PJ23]
MNYRHGFHAGNFADVLKHSVLALIVRHLLQKAAPFRYIDTHAGIGLYDLHSEQAQKTGEWRDGVARVWNTRFEPEVAALLAPWQDAVNRLNPEGGLRYYPGSPELVRALARPDDRLVLCELHPQDAALLGRRYARDKRMRVVEIDGWTGLNAYVPPKERRGLVLVDPPFEEPDELLRMVSALDAAHRKWPTGTYALWYPVKDPGEIAAFTHRLANLDVPSILGAEIMIQRPEDASRLNGTGLVIVNPPWTLERDLRILLPALARVLGRDGRSTSRVFQIAGERRA